LISVPLNGYLLTCRLNSTNAYYKTNAKTQKEHKIVQIHQKALNKQNKNNMAGKKQYKRSNGAKALNPEKHRQVDIQMSQISA